MSRPASPVTQLVVVCGRTLARWVRRRPTRRRRPALARHDPRTTALAAGRDSSASAAPVAKPAEPAEAAASRAYQQRLGQLVRRGINISLAPYGYRVASAEPSGHPRLVPDPPHDRVVAQIFTWRVHHHLDIAEIAARLRRDPHRYPPPGRGRWTNQTVAAILTNPRYTGYQVWRYRDGNTGLTQPEQWVVSDRPAHPPLATLTTYLAAQDIPDHAKAALRRRLRHRHSRVAR